MLVDQIKHEARKPKDIGWTYCVCPQGIHCKYCEGKNPNSCIECLNEEKYDY